MSRPGPTGGRPLRTEVRDPELVEAFVAYFELADRHGAATHARAQLRAGRPADEIRDAVGRAQRRVGELWQSGRWTITQEHAATAVAEAVLASLDDHLGDVAAVGRVAIAAADGEWHALPARLAEHAFACVGLDTVFLGAGLPATDVARTLPALGVDALAVSVTMPSNLTGAARTVAAGHSAGLPVLLGGGASSVSRARALGADAHAPSVEAGTQTVLGWIRHRTRPTGIARLRDAEADGLRRARTRLLSEAVTAVEDGVAAAGTDAAIDQTVEDLEQLYDHLAAAVLVDDPAVFTDVVPWLADVHRGRRLPTTLLALELGALESVLADHPAARSLVRDGRHGGVTG
ncbi:B12-binding domain-containing protein [Egicoccus sp. AB-alg6-2]|uniref:cobalamin B12-binding domain-containing protein n=1 Tax=Egicoccus sp. AB-alg6-2 TaxID=3242692 RepID=UPI00359F0CF3